MTKHCIIKYSLIFSVVIFFISCQKEAEISSINPVNWEKRKKTEKPINDSMISGSSYLSIYPQIYSQTEHRTHNLTVTVSMRNINQKDTIFINNAQYFDTNGNAIRTYFDFPIYLAPLETVEIVIDENDKIGGTGANFVFDWQTAFNVHEPLFEGVMISTSGQQGISFITTGIRIK